MKVYVTCPSCRGEFSWTEDDGIYTVYCKTCLPYTRRGGTPSVYDTPGLVRVPDENIFAQEHWWCGKIKGLSSPSTCRWTTMGGSVPKEALGHTNCGFKRVLIVKVGE